MRKFNKVIEEFIDELAMMARDNKNVKEYLEEAYGSALVEDDEAAAVIKYITEYYNVEV